MSFLAPLFLFGALAVALPILFHLIRRTSRERMPFSSLMFLSPALPRVTRRSRLENIFLLLLRCLVLCLLAAGFARPFFKRPGAALPPKEAGKKVAVLIDTSASMRRENLWAAARAKAEEALRAVSVSDQAAVFTFDRQLRPVVSFDQWSAMNPGERIALTMQRVAQIQPTWSATYMGNALTSLAEAFEEGKKGDEAPVTKQIVLISDLQEGSHLEGLQGYEWPKGVEVSIEPVRTKRPTNAGLQLVTEHEETGPVLASPGPRIRVSNSADAKREQFKVQWEGLAGVPVLDTYVPPGQSRIFPAPQATNAPLGEKLVLTGDDEDFDNALYFIEAKAEQVKVLYLGNEPEADSTQPLYYLKRAFQQTRRQAVQIIPHRADAPLAPSETEAIRLIIVTESLADELAKSVREFVSQGGTVLFVLKTGAAVQTLSTLSGLSGLTAEEVSVNRYGMLGEINFQHPLLGPFADPRYSDFTKIHFWKHRRLEAGQLPSARILARFDDDKAPAFLEIPVGKGSLLVLASGWHPADSQLALSSKFVPLLYSMLELSGALKVQRFQYVIGEEAFLTSTNAAKLTVRKPDGSQVELSASEKFQQTDQPGLYTVNGIQPPIRFAVNLDAAESRTAPLPLEEFERFGVPLRKETIKTAAKPAEKQRQHLLATELESQQRLWRRLLVAALVVLLIETWLAGWLTKRPALPSDVQV